MSWTLPFSQSFYFFTLQQYTVLEFGDFSSKGKYKILDHH